MITYLLSIAVPIAAGVPLALLVVQRRRHAARLVWLKAMEARAVELAHPKDGVLLFDFHAAGRRDAARYILTGMEPPP